MEVISDIEALNAEKGLKLVHWNVRSLVKKIDQLRALIADSPIDIITISESWLKSHLHSSLVSIQGFEVLRLDRGTQAKSRKRGGGLLTYIHKKHFSKCEPLLDLCISNADIEAQWTLIHRPNWKNVVICNVYRPPGGNLEKAINYLDDCLKELNLRKMNLFIMGDLNVNYKNKSAACYKQLHFFVQSNGLTQYINNTTRNTDKTKSLIDLAITNSQFVSNSGTLEHYMSDHQPIFIIHKKGRDIRQSVTFKGRSYRQFDRVAFRKALLDLDWNVFYGLTDPEEAWSFILKGVSLVLDKMCPIREFKVKNFRPNWVTNELLEQIKDRDYFYRKAKLSGDRDDWNIARYLRNTTNSNIRKAKREYILDELEANSGNCKKFCKVIKEVVPTGKQAQQDILLKDKGKKIEKENIANFINDYFVNVGNVNLPGENSSVGPYENTEGNHELDVGNSFSDDCPNLENCCNLTVTQVYRIVKDINVSKSSGLNNVSSCVVKEAFLSLVPEVTFMFNLLLTSTIFPAEWKKALVVTIPKTGDLTQVHNFRPISLLPLPGKILEKLVHAQIAGHLESNTLLAETQHGFRAGHSTTHSVAQFANYISVKQDSKLPTLATYIDFRKAFDCVQHPMLLR